jgi:hypothetical protein
VDVVRGEHYEVRLDRESLDRIVTWIDMNAPYYGTYASAYPNNLFGRSPLDDGQLARLAELTGIPLNARNTGAELNGSQVNFTRPELSPCLADFGNSHDPKYVEALSIIEAGRRTLRAHPRADMPGFVACEKDCQIQEKLVTLSETAAAVRRNLVSKQSVETRRKRSQPIEGNDD